MAEIIEMPALSPSMEEGEVAVWHKKVGDKIAVGELVAEITTDKATMDFESPRAGTLLYIGVQAGEKTPLGGLLCIIGDAGESFEHLLGGAATPTAATASTPATAQTTEVAAPSTAASSDESRIKASPLAKSIAKGNNVSLSNIQGSGDGGRIIKRDVEEAISKGVQTPTVSVPAVVPIAVTPTPVAASIDGNFTDVPVSSMRRVIASRLSESLFTAPHFYLTVEINMDKTMEMRKNVNEAAAPLKVSFNDMVVKAVAASLKKHPAINSSWLGDRIRINHDINIGVAVAIPDGLVVPVLRHANQKALGQINSEVRELAGRAKDMKLKPEEMSGSTFTISNLGMFDVEEFTAIINPPNACILAVGGIIQKPIVKNGELAIGNMMKVTLSCDHRVVDGATGAQFLQTLKGILENPIKLLV
jgi:pyruvate dehydrogenase E2 component (dihydrolipoamide acetyltransferase)